MSEHLLIEESPFGCRGLVLDAEERPIRLLHRFRTRSEVHFGDLFWGRAGDVDKRLALQVFDLGQGREGVLPVRDRTVPRGQLMLLGVRREALGKKRPVLTDKPSLLLPAARLRAGDHREPGAGPLGEVVPPEALISALNEHAGEPGLALQLPWVVTMVAALATGRTQKITVSSGAVASELGPFVPEAIDLGVADQLGRVFLEPTMDGLERTVPLDGGGCLVIDQTEALTAVDVDLGATSGQSKAGAGDSVRRRALDTLGRHISIRSIGGQVVLDLPRSAVRTPKVLRDQLSAALKPAGLGSVPATTKEGLVVLIFGQNRKLLLDHLTVPVDADIRDGRTMAPDMEAWIAHSLAEEALTSAKGQALRLSMPPSALKIFEAQGGASDLESRFGVPLHLQPSTDGLIDMGPVL